MPYLGAYEDVFNIFEPVTEDAQINRDVSAYRTRTIKSGDVLEVEAYPIWATVGMAKEAKKHRNKEASDRYNANNRLKKIIRKINANFTEEDLFLTLTYSEDNYVPDRETAKKDKDAFIRRVKRMRKKLGLSELKYISVIEFGRGDRRRKRCHHHFIMSGMDRDMVEALWGKGRCNASRLQPDEYGLERVAKYILKETGKKTDDETRSYAYSCSRNLVEPKIQYSDKKLSRRRAAKLAEDCEIKAALIFSRLYPGYKFVECTVKTSSFVSGAYIHAQLIREKNGILSDRSRGAAAPSQMGRFCQEHSSGNRTPVSHSKRRKKE